MIQLEKRIRTTVRMNNENDVNRTYNISAEVEYHFENENLNIHSGAVLDGDSALATFSKYLQELNVQYINLTEEQQMAVLSAINDFINEVKESVTINL
ncbi:MAG: hypothetical protein IKV77_04545 [Alistipes sp.]|nr:hypothetical protein [Alistipes sp.]